MATRQQRKITRLRAHLEKLSSFLDELQSEADKNAKDRDRLSNVRDLRAALKKQTRATARWKQLVKLLQCAIHKTDPKILSNRPDLKSDRWKLIRAKLISLRGPKCEYCGSTSKKITVDHVIPYSLGGTDKYSNLAVCCPSCNSSKGNRPLTNEWINRRRAIESEAITGEPYNRFGDEFHDEDYDLD